MVYLLSATEGCMEAFVYYSFELCKEGSWNTKKEKKPIRLSSQQVSESRCLGLTWLVFPTECVFYLQNPHQNKPCKNTSNVFKVVTIYYLTRIYFLSLSVSPLPFALSPCPWFHETGSHYVAQGLLELTM